MTTNERERLYTWINLNPQYKDQLEKVETDVVAFEARFDPNNQYRVTTVYNGKTETHDCFKLGKC